jgi:hypothetical protein
MIAKPGINELMAKLPSTTSNEQEYHIGSVGY